MQSPDGAAVHARAATRSRWHSLGAAVALCVAGLLVAGCGSSDNDGDGDGGKGGDGKAKKPQSSPAESGTPSRTSSPSPSPTASPSPTYSATKDLKACFDGECTVEVEEDTVIPFSEDVRLPDLHIDAIGESGVDMTASGAGTVLQLSGQTPAQGGASTLNETSVGVLAITGDTAVLHIFPADD